MARMCIVLTLLASACVAQAEPITLNVMSFNIRFEPPMTARIRGKTAGIWS